MDNYVYRKAVEYSHVFNKGKPPSIKYSSCKIFVLDIKIVLWSNMYWNYRNRIDITYNYVNWVQIEDYLEQKNYISFNTNTSFQLLQERLLTKFYIKGFTRLRSFFARVNQYFFCFYFLFRVLQIKRKFIK